MRLSDVIRSLDELKPRADMHYVLVRRELPPDRLVTALSADLERALAAPGSDADILLEPRDRIFVFDSEIGRDRILAPLFDEMRLQSRLDRPMQIVGVGGRVKAPGRYPLEPGMRVSDLIRAGGSLEEAAYGGEAELTRHRIVRRRVSADRSGAGGPRGRDRAGMSTADIVLESYDYLSVKEMPRWNRAEAVEIVGEVRFPGTYPMKRGETLALRHAARGRIDGTCVPRGQHFPARGSSPKGAGENRAARNAAGERYCGAGACRPARPMRRPRKRLPIGQSLLLTCSGTKPVGRLVFDLEKVMASGADSNWDIAMKDGDRIMVPRRAQEVTVIGEVQTLTSHLYRPDLSRDDYIALSGGTTKKADKDRIYVVRADGSVVTSGSRWFGRSGHRDTAGRHDRRAARRRAHAAAADVGRSDADPVSGRNRGRCSQFILTRICADLRRLSMK